MTSPISETSERLEELSSDDIAHLRECCQTDLFFLARWGLGYSQVSESAHGALCRFMTDEKRNRRMVLMPRGHLKTTICTISDSIRLSLCDPNTRILIQNEVFDNAADMLKELKGHWENGQLLRMFFPELVPTRFAGQGVDWAKDSASIIRSQNFKESTYTASGSGGSPQSKHFKHVKNDDLIGEDHKESENMMLKAIRWSDGMTPLLDSLDDQIDYYGTRKTMADVYAHQIEMLGDDMAVFVREPIENDEPIFPEKFTMLALMRIMNTTPEVWAHDYMNNPIGKGGLDWGKGLLRPFALVQHNGEIWVQCEDHITGLTIFWSLRELDITITVDPNSGQLMAPDKAAVIVHGVSPREQIFVLEATSGRWSPDGLIDKIWDEAYKWHPRVIGIEKAGQQNTMYYFEKRCSIEGMFYNLKPLAHHNQDKTKRIRTALDSPLKARRLYIQPGSVTLISQIQLFPQLAAHNWDEIDALGYGPEVYQTGMSLDDLKADEEAEEKVLELRGVTGYGESV